MIEFTKKSFLHVDFHKCTYQVPVEFKEQYFITLLKQYFLCTTKASEGNVVGGILGDLSFLREQEKGSICPCREINVFALALHPNLTSQSLAEPAILESYVTIS